MTDTKERPILFSAAMIRAILDGTKTQTRRVVRQQPPHSCHFAMNGAGDKALCMADADARVPSHPWFVPPRVSSADTFLRCPYGVPGERLWVLETFALSVFDPEAIELDTKNPDDWDAPVYKADVPSGEWHEQEVVNGLARNMRRISPPWRPSIHMPRWASRIDLEVTGVRVERVQDISEEDARAEGCRAADFATGRECLLDPGLGSYRLHFSALWDSINGKREGCSWEANPWLWVVEFKRVRP